MNELINKHPDINVQETEYIRLLGFPQDYELEGRSLELADWARDLYTKIGRPWIYGIKSTISGGNSDLTLLSQLTPNSNNRNRIHTNILFIFTTS